MDTELLTSPPEGARHRLTAHYGQEVTGWLDAAPDAIQKTADEWELAPLGYHDAGHASLIVPAVSRDGARVVLKAWPDADRFRTEVAALSNWLHAPVPRVIAVDDVSCIAALEQIGAELGGSARPDGAAGLVASAIHDLHRAGRTTTTPEAFPALGDYIDNEVHPRITRRRHLARAHGLERHARVGTAALARARQRVERTTLLHADLYQENTLFDTSGRPVLIDPLPTVGDAAFDWAFWTVYYTLGTGTEQRLRMAVSLSGIDTEELLPWCLLLCLDGLLYYLDTGDERAPVMASVLLKLGGDQVC